MSNFYTKPYLGPAGQAETWIQNVESTHDIWCSCPHWLGHLLDIVYPSDSQNRSRTIDQIIDLSKNQFRALPSLPLSPWPISGGENTADPPGAGGDVGGGPEDAGEKELTEEELLNALHHAENGPDAAG